MSEKTLKNYTQQMREISQVHSDIYCDTCKQIEAATKRKISSMQIFFGKLHAEQNGIECINVDFESSHKVSVDP